MSKFFDFITKPIKSLFSSTSKETSDKKDISKDSPKKLDSWEHAPQRMHKSIEDFYKKRSVKNLSGVVKNSALTLAVAPVLVIGNVLSGILTSLAFPFGVGPVNMGFLDGLSNALLNVMDFAVAAASLIAAPIALPIAALASSNSSEPVVAKTASKGVGAKIGKEKSDLGQEVSKQDLAKDKFEIENTHVQRILNARKQQSLSQGRY